MRIDSRYVWSLLVAVVLVCPPMRSVAAPCELGLLLAADAEAHDEFGFSVAIDADVAIVGAHRNDDGGNDSGSAYVYRNVAGQWGQRQKLLASDAVENARFGYSVAISTDVVVIGSPAAGGSGAAYVFRYDSGGDLWVQEQILSPVDATPGDQFGISVAVDGDTIVVGAFLADTSVVNAGAAYVFRYDAGSDIWADVATLTAPDAAFNDQFGISASISGDVIVVGAWTEDDGGNNAGSAYVFRRQGEWTLEQKLVATDAAAFDEFGQSVSVDGDLVVIGAARRDHVGSNSGAAYVFGRVSDVWVEAARLSPANAAAEDQFGFSVSVEGDTVVVGAWLTDDGGDASGSAYVFGRMAGMWIETDSFTASDAAAFDEFGRSVALSGDLAIVGAWLNDDVGDSSGSAYVFGVVGGDCDGNGQSDACVSLFDWTGDELIALDDFSGFVDCSAGANLPPDPDHLACVPSCLLAFDADADGDVDLLDWAAFQVALDR